MEKHDCDRCITGPATHIQGSRVTIEVTIPADQPCDDQGTQPTDEKVIGIVFSPDCDLCDTCALAALEALVASFGGLSVKVQPQALGAAARGERL